MPRVKPILTPLSSIADRLGIFAIIIFIITSIIITAIIAATTTVLLIRLAPALYRDKGVIIYLKISAIKEKKKKRKGTKLGGIANLYTNVVPKAACFNL